MLSLIGVYTACNVYLNRDTKRFIILIMWLHKLHVSANQWNLSNGLRRNWEGIALCSSMSADYCTTKCKDMVVSPDVIVILQSCHTNHCTARVQHTHTDPPLQKLWYWSPPLHLLSLKMCTLLQIRGRPKVMVLWCFFSFFFSYHSVCSVLVNQTFVQQQLKQIKPITNMTHPCIRSTGSVHRRISCYKTPGVSLACQALVLRTREQDKQWINDEIKNTIGSKRELVILSTSPSFDTTLCCCIRPGSGFQERLFNLPLQASPAAQRLVWAQSHRRLKHCIWLRLETNTVTITITNVGTDCVTWYVYRNLSDVCLISKISTC